MGNPFTVEMPYDQLMLLLMGLFMFVGATRGAYREALTTFGLVVLLALLIEPALATPIITYLAKLVRLIIAFVDSGFSVDPKTLIDYYEKVQLPFGAENPYALLIFVLVCVVLLSYGTRAGDKDLTALSRILGGLLGLFNGFLVVSLFKEYLIKYVQQRMRLQGMIVPQGAATEVSVALKGFPTTGPLAGDRWQYIVALLGAVAALLFLSSAVGMPLKKKK